MVQGAAGAYRLFPTQLFSVPGEKFVVINGKIPTYTAVFFDVADNNRADVHKCTVSHRDAIGNDGAGADVNMIAEPAISADMTLAGDNAVVANFAVMGHNDKRVTLGMGTYFSTVVWKAPSSNKGIGTDVNMVLDSDTANLLDHKLIPVSAAHTDEAAVTNHCTSANCYVAADDSSRPDYHILLNHCVAANYHSFCRDDGRCMNGAVFANGGITKRTNIIWIIVHQPVMKLIE